MESFLESKAKKLFCTYRFLSRSLLVHRRTYQTVTYISKLGTDCLGNCDTGRCNDSTMFLIVLLLLGISGASANRSSSRPATPGIHEQIWCLLDYLLHCRVQTEQKIFFSVVLMTFRANLWNQDNAAVFPHVACLHCICCSNRVVAELAVPVYFFVVKFTHCS